MNKFFFLFIILILISDNTFANNDTIEAKVQPLSIPSEDNTVYFYEVQMYVNHLLDTYNALVKSALHSSNPKLNESDFFLNNNLNRRVLVEVSIYPPNSLFLTFKPITGYNNQVTAYEQIRVPYGGIFNTSGNCGNGHIELHNVQYSDRQVVDFAELAIIIPWCYNNSQDNTLKILENAKILATELFEDEKNKLESNINNLNQLSVKNNTEDLNNFEKFVKKIFGDMALVEIISWVLGVIFFFTVSLYEIYISIHNRRKCVEKKRHIVTIIANYLDKRKIKKSKKK